MARPGEESVRVETGRQVVYPTVANGGVVDLCADHKGMEEGYSNLANDIADQTGLGQDEHADMGPREGTCAECARRSSGSELANQLNLALPPGYLKKQDQSDRKGRTPFIPGQSRTKAVPPLPQSLNARKDWPGLSDEHYEKYIKPHEEPETFWRAHLKSHPFSRDDAWSADLTGGGEARGYSSFRTPQELHHYLTQSGTGEWGGWNVGDRDVIHFKGHEVGTGVDGEPLAEPISDEPEGRMSWETFNRGHRTAAQGHYCKACGEHHDNPYDVEDHEWSYTDWDKHYPHLGDVHRGMSVKLPAELHDKLHHDEDYEHDPDEVMHEVIQHLSKRPLGTHWSANEHVAKDFGHTGRSQYAKNSGERPHTDFVLTAEKPQREDIETDRKKLAEDKEGIQGYDTSEREVPMKSGARLRLKGIQYKLAHHSMHQYREHPLDYIEEQVGPMHVHASSSDDLRPLPEKLYHVTTARDGIDYSDFPEGDRRIFDAHHEGRNVGYVTTQDKGDHVWLDEAYVHPDFRGSGIARDLMDRALSHHQGREVRLKPEPYGETAGAPTEALRHFYEGYGFQPAGEHMVRTAAQDQGKVRTYYHGTANEPPEDLEYGGHVLPAGAHLHPDAATAWKHAIKHWNDDVESEFPRVYRAVRHENEPGHEHTPGGGIKLTEPAGATYSEHEYDEHPPIKIEGEHGPILFHGTTHYHEADDNDLNGHTPPHEITASGGRPSFGGGTHDPGYAYATKSLSSAWTYAEDRARNHGSGTPHVYRVTPKRSEDLEEDPFWATVNGKKFNRGTKPGDMRAKSGFDVLDEVPPTRAQHRENVENHQDEHGMIDWDDEDGDEEGEHHWGSRTIRKSQAQSANVHATLRQGGDNKNVRTAAKYPYNYTRQTATGYEDIEGNIEGPLFHGSNSKRLKPGDQIKPGRKTNNWGDEGARSKHVYFTQHADTAGSYARSAGGHVYEVEPTGEFHMDYSGGDYKTKHPLTVLRVLPEEEWNGKTAAMTPERRAEIERIRQERKSRCLTPEEAKRQPTPGQGMIPGTEHMKRMMAMLGMTASWDDDDDEDEPDECEYCGEDKNSEDHAEGHQNWLHDQKWHTMWDEDREVGAHNNGEIQRGMAISLPKHIHDLVHDEDRPIHERGKALADHVVKSINDGGHIGRFWTDEDDVSRNYATGSRVNAGSKDDNGTPATPAVVHVKFPGYHHIETDPDELERHGVYSYHIENNREVPLQPGTPLEVKGVSWAHHKYGDDGARNWDRDNAEWKRHDFKEPIKAMSSLQKLALPADVRFHFLHADQNERREHLLKATVPHANGRKEIGSMTWDPKGGPNGGMVQMIRTHDDYQRQGVANALWDRAHEVATERSLTPPQHSDVRTPHGIAWVRGEEGRGLRPMIPGQQPLFDRPEDNETIHEEAPRPQYTDMAEHLGHEHGLGMEWVRRAQERGSTMDEIHNNRHKYDTYGESGFHAHSMKKHAHDSGDSQRIFHCPFCGGGQVIGRSDGTTECEFCQTHFTVQVQPQFNSFPQTDPETGMPIQIPGMPGQNDGAAPMGMDPNMPPGAPGAPPGVEPGDDSGNPFGGGDDAEAGGEEGSGDDGEDDGDDKPDFLKSKSSLQFQTGYGHWLNEDQYVRHLAVMHAQNKELVIRAIRRSQ